MQSHRHKQSHQIKALMYKNIKIQARQPCTNICQIITPIICLIFTILIRNIAISKIPNDNDSIFNQFPMFPQKFNNYTFEDLVPKFVQRSCTQWYNFQVKKRTDINFVGQKNDRYGYYGLLARVPYTYNDWCNYNLSLAPPQSHIPPIFINDNGTVNHRIMDAINHFNEADEQTIKQTSILDKIPDGSVVFESANITHLEANLKINDLRILDYHRPDGITKIRFRTNETGRFSSYYLISEGFLTLQHTISAAYVQYVTHRKIESGVVYMPFLTNNSVFVDILVNTITTILFPLSLSLLLPVFLYLIVLQKQQKLIQMMRMNGMKMRNYWLVNFIFNFGISIITNAVFFVFGYIFLNNNFFTQTGKDILFLLLFGGILSQIGMSTFFQVFLASSRAANIIGYLISIWTNLIGATLSIALFQYPRQLPTPFLLYPTFAFNRVFYILFTQCSADRCASSLSRLSHEGKMCILVLYISFIILQLLGMYLFQVIPQQYGTRQPLHFPLQFITSKFKQKKSQSQDFDSVKEILRAIQNQDINAKNQRKKINQIEDIAQYPLIVCGLRKVYSNGKIAVKGMDLLIEDNEVFGLLGPNGAGKTTLISMITGVFEPTCGDCFIGGHSITTQIEKVHVNIGVCPQFDILWPQLTVQQHLYFYARLRGTKSSLQKQMVAKALDEVNLTQFKNFKSGTLSGGMKRRLSVGISMVGDPRIVFLDEPTTGLDPQNRRHLWDVLNKCRQNRALFLTTHLMEQADALCNRIGIITQGILRTVGTQQTLKKVYGNGYYLSLNLPVQRPKFQQSVSSQIDEEEVYEMQQQTQRQSSSNSIMSMSQQIQNRTYANQTMIYMKLNQTKMDEIKKKIYKMFHHAILEREISGYMRFNLGNIVISQVMKKIAQCGSDQIIGGWGLTNSNLQDVFLHVVRKFDKEDQDEENEQIIQSDDVIITKSDSIMSQQLPKRVSIQNQQ